MSGRHVDDETLHHSGVDLHERRTEELQIDRGHEPVAGLQDSEQALDEAVEVTFAENLQKLATTRLAHLSQSSRLPLRPAALMRFAIKRSRIAASSSERRSCSSVGATCSSNLATS